MTWMPDPLAEWLETDGLGGYAMGTVGGRRTRRYHGLLIAATSPPTGRMLLVNGFDARVQGRDFEVPLTTQLYLPYAVAPDNSRWLDEFTTRPWPTWTFVLPDGTQLRQELWMPRGMSATVLRWRRITASSAPLRLSIRPFLSGRDHHAIHRENPVFDFSTVDIPGGWVCQPYPNTPPVCAYTNGRFQPQPLWYRQFLYEQERERGLEDVEDLASPGEWSWNLATDDAVLVWSTDPKLLEEQEATGGALDLVQRLAAGEAARRSRLVPATRAADIFLIEAPGRATVIAGYPWFTDWGRDTFIALRGLCLATGNLETAGAILEAWSEHVSEGMLPNRFPDAGAEPEFNAADASLWFVIVAHEYLDAIEQRQESVPRQRREKLLTAVADILRGYRTGTRYQIHMAEDGLLAAGVPGVQLTWMDAKVGDWVVTPRIGKPVELQALWLAAVAAFPDLLPDAAECLERGQSSLRERYWNPATGCLVDVIDVDHIPGKVDASIRPNQLFALGPLVSQAFTPEQVRRALEVVEQHLLTPLGLRTLSPSAEGYCGRYQGNVRARDAAYHQGTVWPWLLGPFVEVWLQVHGRSPETLKAARDRFLVPPERHRKEAGLDHISEIADGDAPHTPRGCPFQAWSTGEFLRMDQVLLNSSRQQKPAPLAITDPLDDVRR